MPLWTFQLKVYSGKLEYSSTVLASFVWGCIFLPPIVHTKPRLCHGLCDKEWGKKEIENETRQNCGANSSWLFHWRILYFFTAVLLKFGFSLLCWVFSCIFIGLLLGIGIIKEQKPPKELNCCFFLEKFFCLLLW